MKKAIFKWLKETEWPSIMKIGLKQCSDNLGVGF